MIRSSPVGKSLLALVVLSWLAATAALAQPAVPPASSAAPTAVDAGPRWAIQVVALRDYREAQAQVASLRTLGFTAYTEFAMLDAQQWVRVRIGCFASREAADAMAVALRARITAEAQAVELSAGALVPGCTEEVVGFLNAYDWRLIDDAGPVMFAVTVANVTATVAHDGNRWRVVQEDDQIQLPVVATPGASFEPRRIGGVPFVSLMTGTETVVVCPGELVASIGDVAIVERGDQLVACRYVSAATAAPAVTAAPEVATP